MVLPHSRLTGPDLVSQLAHELELVDHVLARDRVAEVVAREAALGADAHALERLLAGLARALGHVIGSLVDALLHLAQVLELGELAGDDSHDDVLVGGQLGQWLEAAGAVRVVLEEVGVDVDLLEELGGDAVVAALGEVARVGKVATAQVQTDVQVGGPLGEAVVVQLDVAVKEGVGVLVVVLEPLEHLLGAEVYNLSLSVFLFSFRPPPQSCERVRTGQVRIVDGDVAQAGVVEDLQLGLVGLGNIGKVLGVVGVHLLGIRMARLVAQVVPVRSRESQLGLLYAVCRQQALEVVPLGHVGAAHVLDLSGAYDGLARLMSSLSYDKLVSFIDLEGPGGLGSPRFGWGHVLNAARSGT